MNLLLNMITGISASVIWNSSSVYISEISNNSNKGKFFGINAAINNFSHLTGSGLSTLIFMFLDNFWYYNVLFSLSLLISVCFLLLPTVEINQNNLLDREEDEANKMGSVWIAVVDKTLRPLWVYTFFAGYISAFYLGFLFEVVNLSLPNDSEDEQKIKLTYVYIALGLFSFLAGMSSGRLVDNAKNPKNVGFIFSLMVTVAFGLTLYAFWVK